MRTKRKPVALQRKEARQLRDLVDVFVREHGGWAPGELAYPWALPTTLGKLSVDVHVDDASPSPYLTIFGRFEDPAIAEKRLGSNVNPHTGKWNFHGGTDRTPEDVFAWWAREVTPILAVAPAAARPVLDQEGTASSVGCAMATAAEIGMEPKELEDVSTSIACCGLEAGKQGVGQPPSVMQQLPTLETAGLAEYSATKGWRLTPRGKERARAFLAAARRLRRAEKAP